MRRELENVSFRRVTCVALSLRHKLGALRPPGEQKQFNNNKKQHSFYLATEWRAQQLQNVSRIVQSTHTVTQHCDTATDETSGARTDKQHPAAVQILAPVQGNITFNITYRNWTFRQCCSLVQEWIELLFFGEIYRLTFIAVNSLLPTFPYGAPASKSSMPRVLFNLPHVPVCSHG